MMRILSFLAHRACRRAIAFGGDARGQIAIIFGLISVVLVIGTGAGVDLSRAYFARQKLSEVATLTCQFSTRPSVLEPANSTSDTAGGFTTYLNSVNTFATSSLTAQNWNTGSATDGSTGTGGHNYFTATQATGVNTTAGGTAPTNGQTEISATFPTMFLSIAHIPTMTVHTKVGCQTAATTPQRDQALLTTSFETPCGSYCYVLPSGASGTTTTPTQTFPASNGYTDPSGATWTITGYCLEVDAAGVISASDPDGIHSAELDCDNGSGTAGNSAISTKVQLQVGYYELRYNYRSRIDYPNYDPTYLCASTAADLSWANDSNGSFGKRTNQINVYLDINTNSNAPPQHTTIDLSQQLAGSNLIDMCVYSPTWVERSVKIKVTTPADYWLSFAADGNNDSYGGQLDNIRLCIEACTSSPPLQDNFPTAWLPTLNVNKVLFEDSFETTPAYTQDYSPSHYISKVQNLDTSYGTYGASSGWPTQTPRGWAAAPFDQVTYGVMTGAAQGTQYITLDGWNSDGTPLRNRLISRPFLLDSGYYQVSYYYLSMVNFNLPSIASNCVAAPSSGLIYATTSFLTGQIRYYNTYSADGDTNTEGVFFANGQNISTPIAGAGQGKQTSYNNPDGTVSTTPTVPPDNVNYQNYSANVVNPLIDACGYADNWQWKARSVSVKITKPGFYWLTFSANGGTADGNGAAIDDVKLTALGSPSMTTPPTSPLVNIPVPAPQPDTLYNQSGVFTGFSIIADPFIPPAVDQ